MRAQAMFSAALCLVLLWTAAWPFTVDDAFIAARYAARLARGLGYTFDSGPPTDGVTGPLWLLPLVAGVRAGIAPVLLGKWLSLVAGAVALLLVIARTKRVALGDRASWSAALVGAAFPFVVWSVAGLETGLAALAATGLALAVTERPGTSGYLAGTCLAALAWLRPELLPFGGVLAVALALRDRRAGGRALALAGAGWISLAVFRYASFGHWWPMTASAKPPLLGNGVGYLSDALFRPRSAVLAILLAGTFAFGGRAARILGLALVFHAASVVLVGGDWMPGRRLFAPVIPALALAIALGLRKFSVRRPYLSSCSSDFVGQQRTQTQLYQCPAPRVRSAGALQKQRILPLAEQICAAHAGRWPWWTSALFRWRVPSRRSSIWEG